MEHLRMVRTPRTSPPDNGNNMNPSTSRGAKPKSRSCATNPSWHRTGCRSPLVNQIRLFLHTMAYWLTHTIRAAIPARGPLATGEFSAICLRLLKVAARVRETGSRIKQVLASNCPDTELFRDLICSLIPRPT